MKIFKPTFWEKRSIISYFLFPLSLIVLIINQIKKLLPQKKFGIKTICVGNIYIGGTGKTSLAIKIYKILNKKYRTVFIKKNYQDQIDEIKQLKKNGIVISENNRKKSLILAQKRKFELAILDDGLQQKNINYDVKIVCFNSLYGTGNNLTIPSGPLREKISEIKNYDFVFVNGEYSNQNLQNIFKKFKKKSLFFKAKYKPINLKNFNLNKKYLMFSGIGNPHEFEKTLKKYKFKISRKILFPDHYEFNDREISKIKNIAKRNKLEIITTEKDYERLNNNNKKNIKYLKIELQIENLKKFSNFLKEKL